MKWQSIETAPYEIDILIYDGNYNPEYHLAWWCLNEDGQRNWLESADDGTVIKDIEPTHWFPIPKPPGGQHDHS